MNGGTVNEDGKFYCIIAVSNFCYHLVKCQLSLFLKAMFGVTFRCYLWRVAFIKTKYQYGNESGCKRVFVSENISMGFKVQRLQFYDLTF